MDFSIEDIKKAALIKTQQASYVTDWRLTKKRDRAARDAARELAKEGGYFVGTKEEAEMRWPGLLDPVLGQPGRKGKHIWCFEDSFDMYSRKVGIMTVSLRAIGPVLDEDALAMWKEKGIL